MGAEFGRQVTEIGMALIGVALVALLVSNASGAATIVSTTGKTFGNLLSIVTLQNNYGNAWY